MSSNTPKVDMFINSSVYHDCTLPDAHTYIRLLTVEMVDDVLHCSLSTSALQASPAYSALSYAWRATPINEVQSSQSAEGSADEFRSIIISGKQCHILENLYEALSVIARRPGRTQLWADAICIDQNNFSEREKQVALMGEIYSKAEEVIVWLGRVDHSTDRAVSLLRHLEQMDNFPTSLAMILPHSLQHAQVQSLVPRHICSDESWQALGTLFCRTWFSRAWVMQEAILARRIIVLCGEVEIDWRTLSIVSGHLSKHWYAAFSDHPFRLHARPSLGAAAKLRSTRRSLKTLLGMVDETETAVRIFLETLIRGRQFFSSDARDKVYSCYGLGKRLFSQSGLSFPEANYSEDFTAGDAFTLTARTILKASTDLSILAYVESMRSSCDTSTPSWVPDWTVQDKIGLGVTGYKRFWAAGELKQQPAFADKSERILCLQAERICSIVATGDTKEDIRHGQLERTYALLELFVRTRRADTPASVDLDARIVHGCQASSPKAGKTAQTPGISHSPEECLWRTLIADTDHNTRRCPANGSLGYQFRSWLAPRDPHGRLLRIITPHHSHANVSKEEGNQHLAQSPSRDPSVTVQSSDFDTAFAIRQALRLFCTDDGRLGLGAVALQAGDSIWVMPGSRVPLILRETVAAPVSGRERYLLVGGAYVHGIMHGEVLRGRAPAKFETTVEIT